MLENNISQFYLLLSSFRLEIHSLIVDHKFQKFIVFLERKWISVWNLIKSRFQFRQRHFFFSNCQLQVFFFIKREQTKKSRLILIYLSFTAERVFNKTLSSLKFMEIERIINSSNTHLVYYALHCHLCTLELMLRNCTLNI